MMGTRETILNEALDLFSLKGYEAVSVRDIARAVGIKESSLYNHFANKQAIFDTLIAEYAGKGSEFFKQMQVIDESMEFTVDARTVDMYRNMSNDQFALIAGSIFDYYFTDGINVKLRRMLTIEQYRNPAVGKVYRDLSFDEALAFQTQLFSALIEADCFIKTDPAMMALAFFSPIFLIFYKFDNNEQSLAQARILFDRHIIHFNQTYGMH